MTNEALPPSGGPCDKALPPEELRRKLKEEPDFLPGERYCAAQDCFCSEPGLCVKLVAHADLPTRFGHFELYGFYDAKYDKQHTAVVKGDPVGAEDFPLRMHSQCHTGDVLGSLRCDCRDQLEAALTYIEKNGRGAVLYLKQEGRGIGLLNKIKAYRLQELGLDTVEANLYLGYPDDARDYQVAAKMIGLLGIKSVRLMTNNPDKIDQLKADGIPIVGRIPVVIPSNPHSARYMETKRERMGHLF
jgi:GTP cyclohydrolase II